ncbi:MAG: c-type cytochrome [Gammaproteobacteria bacterium]
MAQETDDAALVAGYQIYKKVRGTGCAGCHGELGAGGGAFPDLKERVGAMSEADFIKVLKEGKEGTIMPKIPEDKMFAKFSKKFGVSEEDTLNGIYRYIKGVADKTGPANPKLKK